MNTLTNNQRAYLRKLAHDLKPVVHIGRQGVTTAIIQAIDTALTAHELIKVKYGEFKDEKAALTQQIVAATASTLVSIIGNIAIIYRPSPDDDKRHIVLPAPDHGEV